ncbi:hypothetical protein [Phenylobacterium sp.]|uniref:hypothetical protein n=1 Tax=Phenylobacterium sp. TaxID=1871053 RepID=UPI0035629ABC
MLRPVVLLVFLLFSATPALAAKEETYEGSVGAAPVVMGLFSEEGLLPTEGAVTGQYFYRSTRLDIDLSGQWHDHVLELASRLTGDRLTLSRSGDGLVGALTTAKGQRSPVSLHPATGFAALPVDLPSDLSPYARLQLASLKLVPQKTETRNGKTIRWYREPLTGIRLFRLEGGYAPPAMAVMNHALAREQWSEVSSWLQCPGTDGRGSGMEFSEAGKPWLGSAHVSYISRASWSCAGTAHPDFGANGHSFDARTGRELKLDDVLPVGPHPAPKENGDAWFDYRGKVFAPAVVALMKRYHKAEMVRPKDGDEDGCDYSDPEVWNFPSWVLTDKGLWLGAIFARVARACDSPDWAVIPWAALPSPDRMAR